MHAPDDSPPAGAGLALPDEAATLAFGARLGGALEAGLAVWLEGDLGAGKTTLARGLLRALGYAGRVKSPTFTLVEQYALKNFLLYHFDLYRFADPAEWEDAGFRDYFNPASVCLVEWPRRAAGWLPGPDLIVRLDFAPNGEGRVVLLEAPTEAGRRCLDRLEKGGVWDARLAGSPWGVL